MNKKSFREKKECLYQFSIGKVLLNKAHKLQTIKEKIDTFENIKSKISSQKSISQKENISKI